MAGSSPSPGRRPGVPHWHLSKRGIQEGLDGQLWIYWYLQVILGLIVAVLGAVVAFFAYGAAWSPIAIASTSAAFALFVWLFEPWAVKTMQRSGVEVHVYLAMCFYYLVMTAFTIFSGWCLVQIDSGWQFFEENWIVLQNVVFPFTTQLEAKRQFKQFQQILAGVGFFMVLLTLPGFSRMWLHLGGLQSLVRRTFGVLLPQLLLLLTLNGVLAGLTIDAVEVARFATPQGSDSLTTLAVAGLMVVAVCIVATVLTFRWGTFHLTYTLSAALLAPWALIQLITGGVVVWQAEVAPAYVLEHWTDLQNFVGPEFSGGGPNKYAQAASLRMEQAGTLALVAGVTASVYIMVALRSACWAAAVGPASLEAARLPSTDSSLASFAAGGVAGGGPTSGSYGAMVVGRGSPLASTPKEGAWSLDADGTPYQGEAPPGHMEGVEIDAASVGSGTGRVNDTFDTVETPHMRPQGTAVSMTGSTLEASGRRTSLNTFRYGQHSTSYATEEPVSAGQWVAMTKATLGSSLRTEWRCLAILGGFLAIFLAGLGFGMFQLQEDVLCGALSREGVDPFMATFTVQVPTPPAPGNVVLDIQNAYPLGSVQVYYDRNATAGNATVTVRQWALQKGNLMSEAQFRDSLFSTNRTLQLAPAFDDDDAVGPLVLIRNHFFTLTPAAQGTTLAKAKSACVAVEIVVVMPPLSLLSVFEVDAPYVFTNITGYLDTQAFQPVMQLANLSSITGPILIQNMLSQLTDFPDTPLPFGNRSLTMHSVTGNLQAQLVLSDRGADLETGGNIQTSLLMGGFLDVLSLSPNVNGPVTVTCKGAGRIAASGVMTGTDYTLETFVGDIIIDQGEGFVLDNVNIRSTWGHVYLNSLLFLAGNTTTIRTKAGVSGAAVYGNYLDVQTDLGDISLTEVFIGLDTPKEIGNEGLFPVGSITAPYRQPGMFLTSNYGKITLIGISGGLIASTVDGALPFAKLMNILMETVHSDIRVQVNGGGYSGPYQLDSEDGEVIVELEGIQGPSSGYLGDPTVAEDARSKGHLNITSQNGDIDFSLMVNPLGDLGGLF